jgi:Ni/Co efflux regulator RcnB
MPGNERQDNRGDRQGERHDNGPVARYGNRDNHYGRHDNGLHRGQWARGQHLPAQYLGRSYYVDYRGHHLRQPPYGYRWVRVNNDYMMVHRTNGLISSIILGR